jgi:hypothetical protein
MNMFRVYTSLIAVLALAAFILTSCGSDSRESATNVLFSDNFESYSLNSTFPEGSWTDVGGYGPDWKIVNDTTFSERSKVAALNGTWGGASAGDINWDNYKVSALFRSGTYNAIMGRYQSDSLCYVLVYNDTTKKLFLTKGMGHASLQSIDLAVDITAYHKLSMELNGGTINGYVDDVLRITYPDSSPITNGQIGLYGASTWYDEVVVTAL